MGKQIIFVLLRALHAVATAENTVWVRPYVSVSVVCYVFPRNYATRMTRTFGHVVTTMGNKVIVVTLKQWESKSLFVQICSNENLRHCWSTTGASDYTFAFVIPFE
jgi:hypothetical protein